MSVHPTRMRPRRLLAVLGLIGALATPFATQAQNDAKAALIEQGNYWQGMGRLDLAEESWRKLLRVDPQSADAMYGMSQVELARGNAEPARAWIARLRAAHPNDARAVRLQQQSQQAGPQQTDLQRARAAAQAGRTAEAVQLYRGIFDNRPPPEPLAVEYYQLLGGTPQGWDEGRKGLEQLVKDRPDNLGYKLALAQLQTYREPTRREGIRSLAELSKQQGVAVAARASWRQALIWLDARAADAPLYQEYLGGQADPAVQARLDGLTTPRAAAAPSPAAPPDPSAGYWALVNQANAARDKNDLRTAQSLLERAVKIDPRESVGQIALADLRLAAGEFAAAEQGYRRVLERKPDDAAALRGLITAYTRQGRAADALALSQRLTPEQAAQVGGLQDVRVEAARAQARTQSAAGDTAGAQRTLEDAMLAAPDSPWVRLDLANIYRRQGLMAQARGVMDGLLMSRPDMPDALYASALLASDAGDPAAGLQYLDRIPAASRTRDMTQLQRRLWAAGQAQQAQALARQGQTQQARNLLAQTESALGNDMPPELFGQLAGAYADIGDAPRALAMSRQLLTRSANPGIGDRLLYASILLKTQQDVELAAVLRQLQTANMSSAQRSEYDSLRTAFSLRQADALREAGNLEAAYNAMAPVLAERPADPQVLAALARLYSAARDERQALLLYQRILQRNPGDLDTLLAAAASASALREHGEAENYVQAALKQAPDQARVLAATGRIYRNAGDNAKAEQYLRAAVAAESRAAGGLGQVPGQGMPVPAANPFAGMTGGAARSAPMAGGFQPVATAYPAAYPATSSAAVAPSPFAGMRGASAAPVPALPPMPAPATYAAGAELPPGNMPWGAGVPAPQPSRGATSRTATGSSTPQSRQRGAATAPAAQAAPLPTPAAPQYVQAYPLPAPASPLPYPLPVPGSTTAGEGSGNAPLRPGAPSTDPVRAELQDLEAERSTTLAAGSVYRNRDGESGLSRLSDFQIPVEARIPAGSGKIVLSATPTALDAGTMAPDYGTSSRFGAGPLAALDQARGTFAAPGSQNQSGVGLAVGYEGKNLNASIGTTPLGFQETNVVGNLGFSGAITDNVSIKADLSRRAVTDSLLSFAGMEDSRTGDHWGGVVATGARLDVTRDDGTYGLYGYGSGHSVTGRNVADNTRGELGGGMYVHLLSSASSKLTAGMNVDLLRYDKNLSYFTFGQGGYFSPQRYMSVAFPVDWTGRDDRLSWRVNASLGVQSFTQDASPYFPTDPVRQAAAFAAVDSATAIGLNRLPFTGFYAATSHTGLAYNLGAILEYQVAPQLYLGGSLSLNNAQNYRQFTGSAYLRYMFGNSGRLGSPSGSTLRPASSPYTPLL
ncbi:MAG: tetratricopeptide repeat protein [Variovorax sp.]|nr:MAG: tetratricopeptide repeat protein [Variovorax sp.]